MTFQFAPLKLQQRLSSGVLSFPLSDFGSDGEFLPRAFSERVAWLCSFGPCVTIAAGGAGEFFSLTPAEYRPLLDAAIGGAPSGHPVLATVGYGTRVAMAQAEEAEAAGAAGLLLLPPYLTDSPQRGLRAHIAAICKSTRLGVVVYNRANCRLSAETIAEIADECPNFVAFKDGWGDTEELLRIGAKLGDRVLVINGMPTAEVYAGAYFGMGIRSYSSAILNFAPRAAMQFYDDVASGNRAGAARFIAEFLVPYGRIRSSQPGYAVSIVKAGARLAGRDAGPVRPPLAELTQSECDLLSELLSRLGPQD
ncbi:MAG: 5-dehydro-4-deoxyglucarate dehydratase [Hyphomicrobiaceae bacterium]|nr:5-dehydro-4-deoxyglucarate dehydratase [Hyphomicrobiaceae bacterium]